MQTVDQSHHYNMHAALLLVKYMVMIEDSLRMRRVPLIHHNPRPDRTIVGFFTMIEFCKTRAPRKSYFLLKFLHWELRHFPDVAEWLKLPEQLSHWHWSAAWLREHLLRVQPVQGSNENIDSTVIERTISSEDITRDLEVLWGTDWRKTVIDEPMTSVRACAIYSSQRFLVPVFRQMDISQASLAVNPIEQIDPDLEAE